MENKHVTCPICKTNSIFVHGGAILPAISYYCGGCLEVVEGTVLRDYNNITEVYNYTEVTEMMRTIHFENTGMYGTDNNILRWYNNG